ncbi:hypothetical protein [Longibacter sp.]|jgi:hypothetical protein|uniref:hypothetical protein n=1 Tax=Longibacter sp. TaxID=2045415 RepID=UPI003EBD371C
MGSNSVVLPIAIYLAIGITGLSLLALVGFGIRNLTYGKVEPLTMGAIAVPFVVLGILFIAMPTAAEAGIMTLIIMFALSLLGLVYTGVKNLIW